MRVSYIDDFYSEKPKSLIISILIAKFFLRLLPNITLSHDRGENSVK